MPLTHVRAFRVRHHECDADGWVAPHHLLRYMQEAAFDASAAAGYDVARYQAMGRTWLVRETDVEVLRPLRYGDDVEVTTWVADFRRVRSRRAYEVRLALTREVVASARTDWAYLDTANLRPAAIPPEMVAAFMPDGAPPLAPPRAHLPIPPAPPAAYRITRRVEWADLDAAQHVNNAVYLAYLEDCAVHANAACGWSPARFRADGLRIMPYRHQIEYQQPAVWGDELEIATWVARAEGDAAIRYFVGTRAGGAVPIVRARTVWGCADLRTGLRLPMPAGLLDDLVHAAGGGSRPSPVPAPGSGTPKGTE